MNVSCYKPLNKSFTAIKCTVQQGLSNLRDVIQDVEKSYVELINYTSELQSLTDNCESHSCSGSESLRKEIASKESIIQNVASALTTLNETQNFSVPAEIFRILCGEPITTLNPQENNKNTSTKPQNIDNAPLSSNKWISSPKKDSFKQNNIDIKEESLSEIEGTPTGRISPIIQTKNVRNGSTPCSSSAEKKLKKSRNSWSTPEKVVKLSFPTPTRSKAGGKLRQARLNLIQVKQSNLIDLTNSPEQSKCSHDEKNIKFEIKKETYENEDTILPSPTTELSDIANFRFPTMKKVKKEDVTHCETNDSISILRNNNINNIENMPNVERSPTSPKKRHLAENINVANIQDNEVELQSSLSVLRDFKVKATSLKRKPVDKIEPIYKEATVRKKLEKLALPGWSCDECETFFATLYKDDPVMLAKKMNECSKHRGRNNPIRPKTPEGLWNPRWNIPEDTEEFNRRNNAV